MFHVNYSVQTVTVHFLHIAGVYDPLCSAVHPMKYLESDVMWCNKFVMEIAIFK